MSVYLDTSVLVPFLYEETEQREKAESAKRLFQALINRRAQAVITFYVLPELYNYVAENYSAHQVDETFRVSLVELLNVPLLVKPFVDRVDLERLRRRFSITDSNDVFHVVAAIHYGCSAIVTFDRHFAQVASLIPAYTPDEFLATLKSLNA